MTVDMRIRPPRQSGDTRSVTRSGRLLQGLAILMFAVSQWTVLHYFWQVWNEKDGYYSHGMLVPFLAAYMFWMNRGKVISVISGGSWLGVPLLAIGTVILTTGLSMGWEPMYGIAFMLFLYGFLLVLLGYRATGLLSMPVLFLSTMVPMPASMLDAITGRYQIVSTVVAVRIMQLSGNPISHEGNTIMSDFLPGPMVVGGACSGLKLLIALVTTAWFLAYVTVSPRWKKIALVAMALPLSIVINSLRVALIGYVGMWTGSSDAVHSFHDYAGYIGLAMCVVILFAIAWLMGFRELTCSNEESPAADADTESPSSPGANVLLVVSTGILMLAGIAGLSLGHLYDLPNGRIDAGAIPMSFGSWIGHDTPVDAQTRETLSKGALLSRYYTDRDGMRLPVHVFVNSSLDLMAFHNPHICLPGSGVRIVSDETIHIPIRQPRPLDIEAAMLRTESDYGSGIMVYWYAYRGRSMPRAADLLAFTHSMRWGDLQRLLRNPSCLPMVKRDVDSRQITWYRFSINAADETKDLQALKAFIGQFIGHTESYGE